LRGSASGVIPEMPGVLSGIVAECRRLLRFRITPLAFPELDYPDVPAEKDLLAAVSPQRRLREGGDPSQVLFQRQKWIPAFAGMTPRNGG
jgi:hypothetical protein